MTRALAAALLLLPGAVLAQARDQAPRFEACTAIEDDAARLTCYDAAAQRTAAPGQSLFPADPQVARDGGRTTRLLDERWELAADKGLFLFRAYKPVYLLPAFWNDDPNPRPHSPNPDNVVSTPQDLQRLESKFQVSFKTKAVDGLLGSNIDVWTAYTQSSRWQVYDGDRSRPFRETNYEPEVMFVLPTDYPVLGWTGRMAALSFNHQSNGRANPFSRSWNRVILNLGYEREGWVLNLRPWIRLPEGSRHDDNPDIEDYMGRADATLVRVLRNGQQLSLMLRHSLRGGDRSHGAVQFDWAFPWQGRDNFRWHLQLFDGYGESLIDYNHRATYIGLGISLLEWY